MSRVLIEQYKRRSRIRGELVEFRASKVTCVLVSLACPISSDVLINAKRSKESLGSFAEIYCRALLWKSIMMEGFFCRYNVGMVFNLDSDVACVCVCESVCVWERESVCGPTYRDTLDTPFALGIHMCACVCVCVCVCVWCVLVCVPVCVCVCVCVCARRASPSAPWHCLYTHRRKSSQTQKKMVQRTC